MGHRDDDGFLKADSIKQIVRKPLKDQAPRPVLGDWIAHWRLGNP